MLVKTRQAWLHQVVIRLNSLNSWIYARGTALSRAQNRRGSGLKYGGTPGLVYIAQGLSIDQQLHPTCQKIHENWWCSRPVDYRGSNCWSWLPCENEHFWTSNPNTSQMLKLEWRFLQIHKLRVSASQTTVTNLARAHCLPLQAPTHDLWLVMAKKKRKFVIQRFNWIAKF
jgi:hypothetical protein